MTQLVDSKSYTPGWKGNNLPAYFAGDVSAAFLSATLISPVLTAIDRTVVENAASSSRPLSSALKTNLLCTFRHPRLFFAAKPFFYMWTLYAATYTTANGVDSLSRTFMDEGNDGLIKSITFLATCIVNVPLGVWKDVRFVQTFGRSKPPNNAIDTPNIKSTLKSTPKTPVQVPKFPRIVGATFLFRDAITILGSFTLPPMVSHSLPLADPAAQMAAAQLLVPVLSQVVATPVHLLGLDLYSNPERGEKGERAQRMKKSLVGTTIVRCARIIPAFGVGGIVNTGLREWFHGKVDMG